MRVAICGILGKMGRKTLTVLQNSGHEVVFGVDTEEQLAENLAVAAKAEAFANCAAELRGAFDDVPHEIVMPNLW